MSLQVVSRINEKVFEVTVTGEYSITEMRGIVDLVRSNCDQHELELAFVDCRNMTGTMTEAERFAGGQRVAEVLGSDINCVLIMPVGQVTKLGELAAVNRGARFLATDDHTEAIQWLMSDD